MRGVAERAVAPSAGAKPHAGNGERPPGESLPRCIRATLGLGQVAAPSPCVGAGPFC